MITTPLLNLLNLLSLLNFKLAIILTIVAYLLGSISSAILLCRLFNVPDPREQGSKNPGTTNVLRIAGKSLAASVLCLDVLKGFLVVWVAKLLDMPNLFVAVVALAAFIGQLFPIFFSFRGGKGVAITLGILLGFCLQLSLLCLITWVIVFMVSKVSSLAAICATILAIIISGLSLATNINLNLAVEFAVCIIIVGCLILFKHKQNIHNLFNKTEKKI